MCILFTYIHTSALVTSPIGTDQSDQSRTELGNQYIFSKGLELFHFIFETSPQSNFCYFLA